ncbi:MAG: hypothetical protein KBC84_03760 [Proteobacteria bacterium]|nr:hypothetical protein [Pseudomonadota bacterium]
MLCPSCGTDVGKELRFCSDCKAQGKDFKKPRVEDENVEQTKDPRAFIKTEIQNTIIEPVDSADANYKNVGIFFILASILAFIILLVVLYSKNTEEISTYVLDVETKVDYLGNYKSQLETVNGKVDYNSTIAVYHQAKNLIEIGFYRTQLESLKPEQINRYNSLLDIKEVKPDAILELTLSEKSSECKIADIGKAHLKFFNLKDILSITEDINSYDLTFKLQNPSDMNLVFGSLSCDLKEGALFDGRFKGVIKLQKEGGELIGNYSLNAVSLLLLRQNAN